MPLNPRIPVIGHGANHADLVPFLQRVAYKLPSDSSPDPTYITDRFRHLKL